MNNKWREFFNNEESKYEYDPNLSLISEDDFGDIEDYSDILNEAEDLLNEKKKSKKKKKSSGKKDACYYKVRSRYETWPSAYASGALVKCRKVGAKNWGNSTNEELEEDTKLLNEFNYRKDFNGRMDLYHILGTIPTATAEQIKNKYRYTVREIRKIDPSGEMPEAVEFEKEVHYAYSILSDEKSREEYDLWALNVKPLLPSMKKVAHLFKEERKYRLDTDYEEEELKKGSKHELEHTRGKLDKGDFDNAEMTAKDHLDDDPDYYEKLEKANIDERKLTSKPASETNLRDWFKRKGAKGSKGGWVDCNAPDGDGGYKTCGRGSGEKRKRYPACRPTPGACKKMKGSKGKSWGKKDSKRRGKKK